MLVISIMMMITFCSKRTRCVWHKAYLAKLSVTEWTSNVQLMKVRIDNLVPVVSRLALGVLLDPEEHTVQQLHFIYRSWRRTLAM